MILGGAESEPEDDLTGSVSERWVIAPDLLKEVTHDLKARCEASDIGYKEFIDSEGTNLYTLSFKSGRERREVVFVDQKKLVHLKSFKFENYIFLTGLTAICSYSDGVIEAGIRSASSESSSMGIYLRLFGNGPQPSPIIVKVRSEQDPQIEIGPSSALFNLLNSDYGRVITVKIRGVNLKHHDATIAFLQKTMGAILFQLDLLAGIPLVLARVRKRTLVIPGRRESLPAYDLQFPVTEFDHAPMSLYWYGRGATNMPLLQFLAFYQAVEFYFPIYSKSEALRRLKGVLRHPTFRTDSDADIAKLLIAVQLSRAGAFGDERSQLKTTIDECLNQDDLREFLKADPDRQTFFSEKSKGGYQKLTLDSKDSDLRSEVSIRLYEIRCRIVHTKTDARDSQAELLLPFTKEADQLQYDIELMKYVTQQVLIASGRTYVS